MKKTKRKFNKPRAGSRPMRGFGKSAKQVTAEVVKEVMLIPPHKLTLDYVKPKRFT
jgi:hypothetical protein